MKVFLFSFIALVILSTFIMFRKNKYDTSIKIKKPKKYS